MAITDRKLFRNSRPARDTLNRMGGIMASSAPLMNQVQRFQEGGPIAVLSGPRNYNTSSYGGLPTGPLNILPGVNISPPANERSIVPIYKAAPRSKTGTSLRGRSFIAPNRATNPGRAAELELARRALEGGLGSLSAGEQAYLTALMGKRSGGQLVDSLKDYLGDSALSNIVQSAGEIGGTIAGGVGGGITGLLSADKPDQETLGGRLAERVPETDYLKDLGFEFPAQVYNQPPGPPEPPAPVDPSRLLSQLGSRRPPPVGGPVDPGNPLDMSDPQVRALLEQEQRAREITEAGGDVVVDPSTGEVMSSTGESIAELLKRAQPDPVVETESFDIDTDDQDSADPTEPSSEDSAAAARTDTDPNAGASIIVPKPKPENFAEIVAQAKAANAKSGVPPLASVQDEIDTAAQAGTGSAEDIKAEFLKLLPKYEEDSSIQGLNLAMLGFAIAGGESSNPIKNISDGMKKGLPAIIKSKEKRKAFERETDLLASKYVIQRKEADRNRGFTKNDYYVTKDFVGPDNQKYTAGQPLKLNDAAFAVMERQGLTGNLVSGTIYGKMLDNNAKIEKARLDSKPTSYHQKSSKTLDIGGNKIEVYYPTADAPEGTKAFPAGREEGWKSFTGKYTTQLEQLSFGQKSLSTARGILSKGDAVGSAGAFGKALDATKAFVPRSIGERMGLDYDNLSSANELENLNRTLALQLAKPLLQEGGKTISNFERMQVAKALGYSDAAVDSTGTIILGNMNNMFTTQADAENRIALIEGILQRSAEKLHSDYKDTATLFGYELTTPEQAVASAPSGSLGNLEQRDDGKFYFVTGQ